MKKLRIGLDFDGVVAYNPFRIVRAPIAFIKKNILGVKNLKFYVPQTDLQKLLWIIVHESSFFPANGTDLLRELSSRNDIEFHLVTARFHFLQASLDRWLIKYDLKKVFTSINMNTQDNQPHIHKLKMIQRLKLDYFVEDNWDIINYLKGKTPAEIFWIYNITDRDLQYSDKFPYLKKALEKIATKVMEK